MNHIKQSNLFSYLTESKLDESYYITPEQKICRLIRSHILLEENKQFVFQNIALAMNLLSTTLVEESNSQNLYEKFIKLSPFVIENSLRFPLEETIIEEAIKLEEEDASTGPGSIVAPAAPIATPTNNTTGVAKLDYPLGEKPIKRKKADAGDSTSS